VEASTEALYADSATSDIKLVDPRLLNQIREWQRNVEELKSEASRIAEADTCSSQAEKFIEKWKS